MRSYFADAWKRFYTSNKRDYLNYWRTSRDLVIGSKTKNDVLMESKIVLQTENLSIGYQQQRKVNCIAKGIDLTLRKGKLIALVGANGIGKSTLLRTLIGIQPPLSGTVVLNKKNI